jgi:hypothetical protein
MLFAKPLGTNPRQCRSAMQLLLQLGNLLIGLMDLRSQIIDQFMQMFKVNLEIAYRGKTRFFRRNELAIQVSCFGVCFHDAPEVVAVCHTMPIVPREKKYGISIP